MGLDFGKIFSPNKTICFSVPETNSNTTTASNTVKNNQDFEGIKQDLLNFGKNLESQIQSFANQINKFGIKFGGGQLNFGIADVSNLANAIKEIKFPQTICITLGGGNGIDSIFDQLKNALNQIQKPSIPITIPSLDGIPFFPLSNILPSLNVQLPDLCPKDLTDILRELKERCEALLLQELNDLDPLERIRQLIQRLQELCGLLQFTQMRRLLDEIDRAKREAIQKLIDGITDPLEKLVKLHDIACDAIKTGAQDVLNSVRDLIEAIKFESIIDKILELNPRDAIRLLSDEIKKQVQLKNFNVVKTLLNAVNFLKASLESANNIAQSVLDIPENFLDILQDKINELVDLENWGGISDLLNTYDSLQDAIIRQLEELNPALLLVKGTQLLNDALQKLDLGLYNRILDAMASKICAEGTDLLPNLPNVPEINPEIIPSFLR